MGFHQGGLSLEWVFIKVVSLVWVFIGVVSQWEFSSRWSLSGVGFHQSGLSLGVGFHQGCLTGVGFHQSCLSLERVFIRVCFHQDGWSLIGVGFHQGSLSLGWVFIMVVSLGWVFTRGFFLPSTCNCDLLVQSDLPLAGHQEPEGNEL